MLLRAFLRFWILLILLGFAVREQAAAQQGEWISLCGQCLSPSVTSKSGIGTANARVEAKVSRKDAEMWCGSWQPDVKTDTCVREQLATNQGKDTYRASADCTKGRITAVDGNTYTLAGVWTSDIGKGRSRWRDSAGKIVGQDEASGGLSIADQWEVLCPGPPRAHSVTAASSSNTVSPVVAKPAAPPAAAPKTPVAQFSVGEVVEAKFKGSWVPGKVRSIRQASNNSAALDYEVVLDNGQRGILPATMVRKAGSSATPTKP